MNTKWSVIVLLLLTTTSLAHEGHGEEEGEKLEGEEKEIPPPPGEEHVLELNADNFEETIEKNKFVLVEFYAPWCGHCKALRPVYAKLAQRLHDEGSEVKVAKIDATENLEVATKYEIRGYPTIKFFRSQIPTDYVGGKHEDNFTKWLDKKMGDAAITLETVDDLKKLTEKEEIVVIGFFNTDESSEKKTSFMTVADKNDEFAFAVTSNEDVFQEVDAQDGQVILFKKFDDEQVTLKDEVTEESVKKFIATESLPLVVEFKQETAPKIFSEHFKVHCLLFQKRNTSEFEATMESFRTAAKDFKGKILLVYIDMDIPTNERVSEFFGLAKDDFPSMVIAALGEDLKKYRPDSKEITTENVKTFLQDFLDDKLKPYLKSQELPDDWDKNPVKVLVSSNYKTITEDKKKKVLVEFYAPWCGHCKQLEPIYDNLGEKYKDSNNIVIAKIDGTANEVEGLKVPGFPTLYFYPAGDAADKPKLYECERTLDGFSYFLENDECQPVPEEEEDDDEEEEEIEEPEEAETGETDVETETEDKPKDEL